MVNLIIIDDEKLEVEGIKATVDFSRLGISSVYEAYNIRQAKEIFLNNPVDIMLCDIEMPQGSGIELLSWVREHYPKTECIFVTCHADFNYAKQAIKLGSLDYILKPAQPQDLEKVILKAMDNINKAGELVEHSRFSKLWLKHQPLLIERFWFDVLSQKIPPTQDEIKRRALEINLPGLEEMKLLPILIKAQSWPTKLDQRDEKLMEFALKNIAQELILKDQGNGIIVETVNGALLLLIYLEDSESFDMEQLEKDCSEYISACCRYLDCELSCYIGDSIQARRLAETAQKLTMMDKNNVAYKNKVFFINHRPAEHTAVNLPDMSPWILLLDEGERDKIIQNLEDYLNALVESVELNSFVLHQIQQDFMQILHFYLKGKGIQAHQLFSDDHSVELFSLAAHSVSDMKHWMVHNIDKALKYASEVRKSKSVVWNVKQFIELNVGKDLSCEEIANQVFLNPIYLNRIFKKETGVSLSEYIQQRRLKIAKDLLSNTNMPVSTIAAHVGYTNFSHFSRMFRKHTNMSPMDFRRALPDEKK